MLSNACVPVNVEELAHKLCPSAAQSKLETPCSLSRVNVRDAPSFVDTSRISGRLHCASAIVWPSGERVQLYLVPCTANPSGVCCPLTGSNATNRSSCAVATPKMHNFAGKLAH